jgi:inner membrane protein COX18
MPLQIYTKIQARKERDLVPLLLSWKKHYKDEMIREKYKTQNPEFYEKVPQHVTGTLSRKVNQRKVHLHNRWNVPKLWKPVNFLQIPIWISVMESLRAMSGNDKGLVPYLLSLIEPSSSGGTPLHLEVEPSLATEGALWFPDLLAGDPTGILPAALTLSILLNIRTGWKAPPLASLAEVPKIELYQNLTVRGLRTLIQVLALNIGVSSFFYEMPTALLLYWISSTNIATLQTLLLEKLMFKKPPLKPWKQMRIAYDYAKYGTTNKLKST